MINGIPLNDLVIFFVSLLIGLVLHELMHGVTAHWLGDTTAHDAGRLTLNPLAHIDVLTTIILPMVLLLLGLPLLLAAKPVPFNPYNVRYEEFGAALIGLAGPLTNLALAGLAALIVRLGGFYDPDIFNVFNIFISLNIGIFVFNLIPFPPLDGSRVLYAFAPEPVQDFMRRLESLGLAGLLIAFVVLFPVITPILRTVNDFFLQILL